MSYEIQLTDNALNDIAEHEKAGNKSIVRKIISLIGELEEHPTTGTGKPEKLGYHLTGYWSRRITQKHRLIYQIIDEKIVVIVVAAKGHYEDK